MDAAGDAGNTEDNARANGRRDGIGKTIWLSKRLRTGESGLDLVRASPCRPATDINAPRRQDGHTKVLNPTLGIGKIPVSLGASTHESLGDGFLRIVLL